MLLDFPSHFVPTEYIYSQTRTLLGGTTFKRLQRGARRGGQPSAGGPPGSPAAGEASNRAPAGGVFFSTGEKIGGGRSEGFRSKDTGTRDFYMGTELGCRGTSHNFWKQCLAKIQKKRDFAWVQTPPPRVGIFHLVW